jgi:iron complex transport system ATP-binding protein
MEQIFRLQKIHMSYNGTPVLEEISLKVEKGAMLSIVGPNGAGKSTILKLMAGLIKPDKGGIFFYGKDIARMHSKELAQRVGYLPQISQPVFPYNCFDYVMIGRTPFLKGLMLGGDSDREIVRKAMEETDCVKFSDKDINKISVGERQCVFIARALAAEPEVLLLDEPAAALDLEHSVSLYRLLTRLIEKKNITIVVVSHHLNITSQFADRIVLLNNGTIEADGPPQNVLKRDLLEKVYGNSFQLITDTKIKRPIIVPKR